MSIHRYPIWNAEKKTYEICDESQGIDGLIVDNAFEVAQFMTRKAAIDASRSIEQNSNKRIVNTSRDSLICDGDAGFIEYNNGTQYIVEWDRGYMGPVGNKFRGLHFFSKNIPEYLKSIEVVLGKETKKGLILGHTEYGDYLRVVWEDGSAGILPRKYKNYKFIE